MPDPASLPAAWRQCEDALSTRGRPLPAVEPHPPSDPPERSLQAVACHPPPGWARRTSALALLLLAAWLGMGVFLRQPPVAAVRPLSRFPAQIGSWRGSDLPLEPRILQALHLQDYLNRVYIGPQQQVIGLYIAYYPRQQFDDDIHSPKNCLPGAGWLPLHNGALTVTLPRRRIQINDYLVARGSEQELILYWYQQQGRVIRSEYWSKFYQVWDGLTERRSDAALVRVAVPVDSRAAQAQARGVRFIRAIFPHLREVIPQPTPNGGQS